MPSKLCESGGEIAFLVRFVFQMGYAKEVSHRPTSLMCIWMTSAVFLIVVILDVCIRRHWARLLYVHYHGG